MVSDTSTLCVWCWFFLCGVCCVCAVLYMFSYATKVSWFFAGDVVCGRVYGVHKCQSPRRPANPSGAAPFAGRCSHKTWCTRQMCRAHAASRESRQCLWSTVVACVWVFVFFYLWWWLSFLLWCPPRAVRVSYLEYIVANTSFCIGVYVLYVCMCGTRRATKSGVMGFFWLKLFVVHQARYAALGQHARCDACSGCIWACTRIVGPFLALSIYKCI